MNNIRRSTKALAVLIAGYITFYVSLLPGVGINTLIPLIVMIIWFKIRHSHTYTYREIGIISASYLILSICFPIVTYMTGASIISLKDKQAIASVWYPLFPVTYAEADSISRLPVLNIGFWHKHADNDKKRTGITQSADYFLLVDTEGKLGIYCPFSFISREKKLFEKADACNIIHRYYYPYGNQNGVEYWEKGRRYIRDMEGNDMDVFYVPSLMDNTPLFIPDPLVY